MPSTSSFDNLSEVQNKSLLEKGRIVLTLAWPAIVENILQTLVGFVDTLFVSELGLVEVSAVGITQTILQVYFAVFMAIGVGSTSLIARAIGANNIKEAQKVAKQSVLLSSWIGILFGLITLFFAEPILRLMGAEPAVLQQGTIYFRIVAVPSIFISLMFGLGSLLRGVGDTVSPMKAGFWMNGIHILLDYVLIFGLGPLPGFGIVGAAVATVVSRVVGVAILWIQLRKSETNIGKGWSRGWKADRSVLRSMIQISTPAAIERLIMRVGQVFYFGLILSLGTYTFAAHQIAGNIEAWSYLPGYGFAVAAATLVGQQLGAGRPKDAFSYGWISAGLCAVIMGFLGVFEFFGGEWAAHYFTRDASVIQQVGLALKIDAFKEIPLAIVLVLTGALNGAGDTKWPMISTAIGIWIVRVAGVYLLGIQLEWGLVGIWLAILLDNLWRAVFLGWRFHSRKWSQTMVKADFSS
ncbi:MATE family efflux transporter [Thermoflavimicrobium dichotomicum]|uniref:Probable multidrug resistance protein NorM n=1 Tax=Thermoflavimicrobium dichotomicum TaxID=46223 RepID=A0A1I3UHH9_9BACL|nr:MATE family efflux transporter [Thermoflavimicrobium dichotomicum]SFJ81227.1 putative efflux protein, MATE family [Thermoflavimicrobium dichotomicum]